MRTGARARAHRKGVRFLSLSQTEKGIQRETPWGSLSHTLACASKHKKGVQFLDLLRVETSFGWLYFARECTHTKGVRSPFFGVERQRCGFKRCGNIERNLESLCLAHTCTRAHASMGIVCGFLCGCREMFLRSTSKVIRRDVVRGCLSLSHTHALTTVALSLKM